MFEQARGGRLNFFGPRPPAIAARSTGTPESSFSLSHRFEIGSVKTVETTRANTQFGRALGGIKLASTKSDQDIPNVGSAKTFEQLSKLFTASSITRNSHQQQGANFFAPPPPPSPSPLGKAEGAGKKFAALERCELLIAHCELLIAPPQCKLWSRHSQVWGSRDKPIKSARRPPPPTRRAATKTTHETNASSDYSTEKSQC